MESQSKSSLEIWKYCIRKNMQSGREHFTWFWLYSLTCNLNFDWFKISQWKTSFWAISCYKLSDWLIRLANQNQVLRGKNCNKKIGIEIGKSHWLLLVNVHNYLLKHEEPTSACNIGLSSCQYISFFLRVSLSNYLKYYFHIILISFGFLMSFEPWSVVQQGSGDPWLFALGWRWWRQDHVHRTVSYRHRSSKSSWTAEIDNY